MSQGTYRKKSFHAVRQENGDVQLLIRDAKDETTILAGVTLTGAEFEELISRLSPQGAVPDPAISPSNEASDDLSFVHPEAEVIVEDHTIMEDSHD